MILSLKQNETLVIAQAIANAPKVDNVSFMRSGLEVLIKIKKITSRRADKLLIEDFIRIFRSKYNVTERTYKRAATKISEK